MASTNKTGVKEAQDGPRAISSSTSVAASPDGTAPICLKNTTPSSKPVTAKSHRSSITGHSRMRILYDNLPTDMNLPIKLREMEKSVVDQIGSKGNLRIRRGHDAYEIESHFEYEEELPLCLEEHNEEIVKAKESIAEKAKDKVLQNDVVMIYGYSDVIKEVLLAAVRAKIKFSLVIIESSSVLCHLRDDVDYLQAKGEDIHALHVMKKLGPEIKDGLVSVIHTQLSGLSYVIRKVTKLFLSAYALLTNGGVMGKIGTSQVALMAYKMNIPVVVCCETFKFCDRAPADSFFQNERASLKVNVREDSVDSLSEQSPGNSKCPVDTVHMSPIPASLLASSYIRTPVIKYDITPASLVTAVITEVDIFPPTSIPLLLRVQDIRNKDKKGCADSETSFTSES